MSPYILNADLNISFLTWFIFIYTSVEAAVAVDEAVAEVAAVAEA